MNLNWKALLYAVLATLGIFGFVLGLIWMAVTFGAVVSLFSLLFIFSVTMFYVTFSL